MQIEKSITLDFTERGKPAATKCTTARPSRRRKPERCSTERITRRQSTSHRTSSVHPALFSTAVCAVRGGTSAHRAPAQPAHDAHGHVHEACP
eukprot:1344738-Prymnesium_polylepis.1